MSALAKRFNRLSMDIDNFRRQAFLTIAVGSGILAWLWIYFSMERQGLPTAAAAVLLTFTFTAGFTVYQLGRRSYLLGVGALLAAEIGYLALVVVIVQDIQLARSFMLVIVVAGALIGPLGIIATTLVVFVVESGIVAAGVLDPAAATVLPVLAGEQGVAALVAWQASLGYLNALHSAETSAHDTQRHLEETRQHRSELQRTLKSLDLAYAQLERANVELAQAQEIAAEALRFKSEFAAQISHELRTSLNLVLGFSETMVFSQHAYGVRLPQPYLRDVSEIHRNSRHLLALIDDVLDLSKLAAGRMGVRLEPVNLGPVIQESVDIIRPLTQSKGLSLSVDLPETMPVLNLDGARIRQILINLLSNAAHVTSRGGIVVRVINDGHELRIEVSDTGPGIASDALESIFDEFRQLSTTTGSSGLGLAVSRRIVHLMNGRMWAESALGVGTTIAFAFPVNKTVPLSPVRRGMMPARRDSQPPVFVVVCDPEADEVRLLQRHLEEIEIMAATDWDMAISMARDNAARAIIYNGECDHLPALDACPLPVVACPLPGPKQTEEILGIACYIQKPVTTGALQSVLRSVAPEARTLLIVDDDRAAVRMVERMIQTASKPRRVIRAYSGRDALARIQAQRPDAVILDLAMQDGDGLWLIQELKRGEETRQIPLIAVSGCAIEEISQGTSIAIRRAGGFTPTEVLAYLQALLAAVPPVSGSAPLVQLGKKIVLRDRFGQIVSGA